MATPGGRSEDPGSQTLGHGKQRGGACMEQLDHPERLEAEVADQSVMWKKAQEFFQTCDSEGKGFIARTDMQVRWGPHLCSGGVVSTHCVGPGLCSFRVQPLPALGLFVFPDSVTPKDYRTGDSNMMD